MSMKQKNSDTLSIQKIVDALELEAHIEGGYYKQTFKASDSREISTPEGQRVTMTSIYYLLTRAEPIGHFHKNKSDIMHYFHAGDPITYYLIYPCGRLEEHVLGSDFTLGQKFQLIVPGGVWKASTIGTKANHGYGLIGEAVAPGFEYEDMALGDTQELINEFPKHKKLITDLSRNRKL
ncbi:cupin domain-containing protein [Alteromonas sp. 5E99-2]|uniref:cupin domain-containing protein n=1 Tax=Alteromonas sp. 5E99-2 TaxID=2817683 RepID=UPI001A9A0DE7|nr:cupin domain-containing protein [Alteromonas sp. 5E99-2]MBO1257017.1 cupin domain-containing protein [Alteromonas sp. 5E99-2]